MNGPPREQLAAAEDAIVQGDPAAAERQTKAKTKRARSGPRIFAAVPTKSMRSSGR